MSAHRTASASSREHLRCCRLLQHAYKKHIRLQLSRGKHQHRTARLPFCQLCLLPVRFCWMLMISRSFQMEGGRDRKTSASFYTYRAKKYRIIHGVRGNSSGRFDRSGLSDARRSPFGSTGPGELVERVSLRVVAGPTGVVAAIPMRGTGRGNCVNPVHHDFVIDGRVQIATTARAHT